MNIARVTGRQVIDSRGNPTVEADVTLEDGSFGRGTVPSGASTGEHEAVELRDGEVFFGGLGVLHAVNNINTLIAPALAGKDALDQRAVDSLMIELDGTDNKSRLGANAILAVSLAVAQAAARTKGQLFYAHINDLAGNPDKSLPMPMMNVLNGGKHAVGGVDIQETMIVPVGAHTIAEAVRIGCEIFHALKKLLSEQHFSTLVGDEGGFAPAVKQYTDLVDLLLLAVKKAGYEPGKDVAIALDVASSELYSDGVYAFPAEGRSMTAQDMISWYDGLITRYPIVSIEDGLEENAWINWRAMNAILGNRIQLVGDDLLVTNTERLRYAIDNHAGNAILIKPNQIGSVTETIDAVMMAKKAGWRTILSHRSGETEDVSIAHFAIGLGASQIKTGSLSRSDRVAKYNELIRLEEIDQSLQLTNPFARY